MWQPVNRSDCCLVEPIVTCNIDSFIDDMCAEFQSLQCKHKCAITKRKRLLQLAEPKCQGHAYNPVCPCKYEKPGDIRRLDKQMSTRLEQMSYPLMRKLLLFKSGYRRQFPERVKNHARLRRETYLSLYNYLLHVEYDD